MKRLTDLERVLELNGWMDTGEHVRLRVEADVTQGLIAEAVGVSKGCISRYEACARRPSARTAVAYHKALCLLANAEARRATPETA